MPDQHDLSSPLVRTKPGNGIKFNRREEVRAGFLLISFIVFA